VEAIGGGLCRCHLDPRRLTEEDLPLLARCFALSARPRGTTEGLWQKLGEVTGLAFRKEVPLAVKDWEDFLEGYGQNGCPPLHHSEAYEAAYHPHYRVLDRDLAVYAPALRAIDTALRETEGPVIVAVEGRCAAGKTTFAARAAQLFEDCSLFHMDDFFLPPELRTPERLSAPGGNVHYERAAQELFGPLSRGEAVELAAYDCHKGAMKAPVTYPPRRLSIVEGSYALHPALAGYSQVHLFFTCDPQVQHARLERRESAESLQAFEERWVPLEEAYLEGLSIQNQCDVVVDTSRLKLPSD
jgi:uridine kinase